MLRIQQQNYYYYQSLVSKNCDKVTSKPLANEINISTMNYSTPQYSPSTSITNIQHPLTQSIVQKETVNLMSPRSERSSSLNSPIQSLIGKITHLPTDLKNDSIFKNQIFDPVPLINDLLLFKQNDDSSKNLKRRGTEEKDNLVESALNLKIDIGTPKYEVISDTDNDVIEEDNISNELSYDSNNQNDDEDDDDEHGDDKVIELDNDGLIKKRKTNKKRIEWSNSEVFFKVN